MGLKYTGDRYRWRVTVDLGDDGVWVDEGRAFHANPWTAIDQTLERRIDEPGRKGGGPTNGKRLRQYERFTMTVERCEKQEPGRYYHTRYESNQSIEKKS